MKVTIVTIFPEWFSSPFAEGMIRVARENGRLAVEIVNLRTFTDDVHQTVDDSPFGGGPGMIMKIEPIDRALRSLALPAKGARPAGLKVALTSPQGPRFCKPSFCQGVIGSNSFMVDDLVLEKGLIPAGGVGRRRGTVLLGVR